MIVLVFVIIGFSMFYNYLSKKIVDEVEKKMTTSELTIYDVESSHSMKSIDGNDIPELTLEWKTSNPSFTIYEITSPEFNRTYSDKQYKIVHATNVVLAKESISSTMKIKLVALDVNNANKQIEFYYYVKPQNPNGLIQ